jgi:hypothetical protein
MDWPSWALVNGEGVLRDVARRGSRLERVVEPRPVAAALRRMDREIPCRTIPADIRLFADNGGIGTQAIP